MEIYHTNLKIIKNPENNPFICNLDEKEAIRKANRFKNAFINIYEYTPDESVKVLNFNEMCEEWLNFIRNPDYESYDIAEYPMIDASIFRAYQNLIDDKITKEAFWALVELKNPSKQISFNSKKSLKTLTFKEVRNINE